MLEAIGLGMNGVDPELERLGQVELEETVVTEQLERDALAVTGQPNAAIELMVHESERCELLHHRRRRGGATPICCASVEVLTRPLSACSL